MRSRFGLWSALLGAVVLSTACSGRADLPAEPQMQGTPLLSLTGSISALLLQCTPQQPKVETRVVGPDGGEVWVGPHYLVVPKGALTKKVTITGEIVSGKFNSIRFYPEGLQFGSGTKLYMSYKNCSGLGMLLPKKIVYVDEGLNLLDILTTIDLRSDKMAVGDLRHFSRYAVAY